MIPAGKISYSVSYRHDIDDLDCELNYRWTPKSDDVVRTADKIESNDKKNKAELSDVVDVFNEVGVVDIRTEEICGT